MTASTNTDLVIGPSLRMKKGDYAIICEGPMAGVKGEFIRYKGKGQIIIKVDILGQYAGIEILEKNVEKILPIYY